MVALRVGCGCRGVVPSALGWARLDQTAARTSLSGGFHAKLEITAGFLSFLISYTILVEVLGLFGFIFRMAFSG